VIARIRYLTKRLDELQVVDRLPANTDKIFFGAYVSLEDEEGETLDIRIVGHDELDTQKRWISIDAPLAKALLGKEVDDDVTVLTPNGETFYTVTAIRYGHP
ncbi:MAG TPA: transcription elongation factor GreB, partial [Halomonas sp.]|nr:transcription elongation factor GreB [Halomonas sp.]